MDRLATWFGAFVLFSLILAGLGGGGSTATVGVDDSATVAERSTSATVAEVAEEEQDDSGEHRSHPTVRDITNAGAPWRLPR